MSVQIKQEVSFNYADFVSRLEEIIGKESMRSFARRADMSDTGLKRYLYDGTIPPVDRALRLAQAGGVTFDWLIFGIGERPSYSMATSPSSPAEPGDNNEFTTIPTYQPDLVDDIVTFRTDWLIREGLDPSNLVTIRAKGDGMSPTVNDGEIMLVKPNNGEQPSDGLYVLRIGGHLAVKRLQIDLNGVHIILDNPRYKSLPDVTAELSDLDLVGRVERIIKKP